MLCIAAVYCSWPNSIIDNEEGGKGVRYLNNLRSPLGRQTATHFSAQAANAGLGLAIAYLLTGALATEQYGEYQFLVSVFLITMVFFDFGLNPAVKRLVATVDEKDVGEVYGASVLFSLGMGVSLALTLVLFSQFIEVYFPKSVGAGSILLFMAPFGGLYPLYELVLSVTQGRNKIGMLSLATVLPRILFVAVILIIGVLSSFDSRTALVLFLISFGASAVAITALLRPSFVRLRNSFGLLFKEIKEFGFNLYYGRVIDGITNGFDKVLITKYFGNTPTGVYGLGMALVLPVSMFSRAVAASAYKRFTIEPSISMKTSVVNIGGSVVSAIFIVGGWMYLVPVFFEGQYTEAVAVMPYLAIGSALAGMNTPYHAFLSAKRQGKQMRTMSFVTSGLNILLNVVLIPLFSMIGAAMAYIATYGVNLGMNLYYYRSYLQSMGKNGGNAEINS